MGRRVHRRRRRDAAARKAADSACRRTRRGHAAAARVGRRRLSEPRARPGRLALRRDDHRRHCSRLEPHGGRGVLILRGDSDHVGGIRARSARCRGTHLAGARPRDCRRPRHGVPLVAPRHQAVPGVCRRGRGGRHSRGIASRLAWRSSRQWGQGGCGDDVVASPAVRHGLLRAGAASSSASSP